MAIDPKGGVQLLPESRKKLDVKVPGQNRLFIISVIIAVIVLGVIGASFYYLSVLDDELLTLDVQIQQIDQQRDKEVEQRLLEAQKQLTLAEQILSNRIFWSNGLDVVERLSKAEMQFEQISVDSSDLTIRFEGIVNNLIIVPQFVAAFERGESIQEFTFDGVDIENDGVIRIKGVIEFKEPVLSG